MASLRTHISNFRFSRLFPWRKANKSPLQKQKDSPLMVADNLSSLKAFEGDLHLHSLIKETKHSAVLKVYNGTTQYVLKIVRLSHASLIDTFNLTQFKSSDPICYPLPEWTPTQEQTNAFYFAELKAYSSLHTKAFAQHMPAFFGFTQFTKDMENLIAREFSIPSWNRVDQSSTLHGIIFEYIPSVSSESSTPSMPTNELRSILQMDLEQLHKDGFCHNDIKLDNLIFDQVRQQLRWIDFSSATIWDVKGGTAGSTIS